MLGLGLGQLAGLLAVVNPPPATAVGAALFQTGVPHRSANPGDLLSVFALLIGELNPKPAPSQHNSTVPLHCNAIVRIRPQLNTDRRQQRTAMRYLIALVGRNAHTSGNHTHELDVLTPPPPLPPPLH